MDTEETKEPTAEEKEAERKAFKKFEEAVEKAPYASGLSIGFTASEPTHIKLIILGAGGAPVLKLRLTLDEIANLGHSLGDVWTHANKVIDADKRIILPPGVSTK